MFIRITTIRLIDRAFDEIETIREKIIKEVLPILRSQEGWIKTDVIFSRETKHLRTLSFWASKAQASVLEEREPELSFLSYSQFGKFAEYFDTEDFTIEYFDHLETLEMNLS